MKYKVMSRFHALPTEQRVKDLNDEQVAWLYYNIIEEEKEVLKRDKEKLDYLGMYIDYDMAKALMGDNNENEKKRQVSTHGTVNDTTTNEFADDSFESKLAQALEEMGEEQEIVELPGEGDIIGNPHETLDEFLNRVEQYFNKYDSNIQNKVIQDYDDDDIDEIIIDR